MLKQLVVAKYRSRAVNSMTYFPLSKSCFKMHSSSRQIQLDEEKEKNILNILNNNDNNELMKYLISKARIAKIEKWKEKNGQINSVNDLLQLDGFGVKMLEKLCENILKHKEHPISLESPNDSLKRSGTFTIPAVSPSMRDKIKSCVSIFTTVSNLTWAHITLNENGPCHLSDWQYYDVGVKKMHLSGLVRNFRHIIPMIPDADCYVMENPQIAQAAAPGGAEQLNINVQKAQMASMLNYGLALRAGSSHSSENVFYLKKYMASRVFNTLVGNERVSTEQVVNELMRTVYNVEDWIATDEEKSKEINNDSLRSKINIPMDLRSMYNSVERYQRDFLGQALLIGLTFVRLCVLRTPESLLAVSRNPRPA